MEGLIGLSPGRSGRGLRHTAGQANVSQHHVKFRGFEQAQAPLANRQLSPQLVGRAYRALHLRMSQACAGRP
jgi:hypothetical protein